jgi:hypothetical protein
MLLSFIFMPPSLRIHNPEEMIMSSATVAYEQSEISIEAPTIYRDSFTSIEDIIDTVRRWGIIVFPGHVQGEQLVKLNTEFDSLIANGRQLGFASDEYGNIKNIRVNRDKLDSNTYPQTARFFGDSLMSDVADVYYGLGNHKLNWEIFVSELTETTDSQTKPPFALHFDKRNVLKFFLYLTDTDERNGAMRALPGSNYFNRIAREDAMRKMTIADIENVLPEPAVPSVPISGPAGTLFIFDTDVCHGASAVQPGFTRRTMRGHTHCHEMLQAMGEMP